MKAIIRFWRILAVCIVLCAPGFAAFADASLLADSLKGAGTDLPSDSSVVHTRLPSADALESFKTDKDFSYLYAAPRNTSGWAHFWIWLGQQLERLLREGEGLDFWGVLLYRVLPWLLIVLAIVLVVMKLLGIDPDSLLRKKAVSTALPFRETAAAAYQDDLDLRLEEALGQKNFRLAIRLYYLDILRQLAAAGLIEWHPDKTNRQYFQEISSGELREPFGRLTRLFEYIWYGEASPGQAEFEAARSEFQSLKNSIGSKTG